MATDERLVELLGCIGIFSRCSEFDLKMISHRVELRSFAAGDTLMADGDDGASMLLLVDGTVDVLKDGALLRSMGAGEVIGELAALSPAPRSATVVATSAVEAAELSAGAVKLVMGSTPSVAEEIVAALADRVRELTPGS